MAVDIPPAAVPVQVSAATAADDEQALKRWRDSVRSAFQQARAHEADIARSDAASAPRFPNLDAQMPSQEVRTRLTLSHFDEVDEVSECRAAVLQFRWLAAAATDTPDLFDPKVAKEVRDYVGSARRCEAKAKLPTIGTSRLREAADVIASKPEPAVPPPASLGMDLQLAALSGGKLADVTLNEVFRQMLNDGIQARNVTVFAHPSDPVRLQATAAFLARFYVDRCGLDMVRVLVVRDDLPTQLARPGTWLDVNRLAAADYDPRGRVFSTPFEVTVARRLITPDEVEQVEFYNSRMRFHEDQGMTDPDEVDEAATRDVVAKFAVAGKWTLPRGNDLDTTTGDKVEIPVLLLDDAGLRGVLGPTCGGFRMNN